MNEEKIAKSVKTLYIITYSIMIILGIIWMGVGAIFFTASNAVEEFSIIGYVWVVLGVFFTAAGIGWLIYFIKMPEYSITYKDGKLNFRNKLECTPAQLDYIEAKGGGIDGAIFSFGRIVVYVNGQKYNFKFIQDAQYVANRLYELKNGSTAMQNSMFGTAYPSAPMAAATEAPAPAPETTVTENVETVAEQIGAVENEDNKEEGNG